MKRRIKLFFEYLRESLRIKCAIKASNIFIIDIQTS